jgi:phosphoribosylformylglycinamidine synthase
MPIVSGNVSFYNQTDSTAILPTPSIGVVGLINDVNSHITPFLKKEGNNLYLINFSESNICGSEYISNFYPKHEFSGRLSKIDFDSFINFINFVKNEKKSIYSMHDTGLGGVIVELSKMIIYSKIRGMNLGINLNEKFINERLDKTLFGEGLSVIIEGNKDIETLLGKYNLDFKLLGKVSSKDSFLGINSKELVNSFYKEM